MNAACNRQLARLISLALLAVLATCMATLATAAPCFDEPHRAYEYLLSQENASTQAREQYSINLNRARESELVSLEGIGSSKAQAIILYRDMFGPFQTIDELAKVKGIGAKTVEKNRERLRVQE